MARIVIPFYPHHVTQRGNRRPRAFFGDADYATYMDLAARISARQGGRCGRTR